MTTISKLIVLSLFEGCSNLKKIVHDFGGSRHKGVDRGGLYPRCSVVAGSSHRLFWAGKNAAGTEFGNFVCCILGYALFVRGLLLVSVFVWYCPHTSRSIADFVEHGEAGSLSSILQFHLSWPTHGMYCDSVL